jgi:PAS domain S-box-containing protein
MLEVIREITVINKDSLIMKLQAILLILLISVSNGICAENAPVEPLKVACFEIMPHYHLGADDQPRGVIVDFWNLWSSKTGVPVSFHTMSFAEMLKKVSNGEMDLIMGQIRTTDEFDKVLDFTKPLYGVSGSLFSRVDAPHVQKVEDLAGAVVGIVKGSPAHSFLGTNQPRADIREYATYEELVQSAVKGEVKYFLMLENSGMTYLAKLGGVNLFRVSEKPFYTLSIQSGVKKGNTQLLNLLNQGILAVSKTEIDDIIGNWMGNVGSKGPGLYSATNKITVAYANDAGPVCFMDENGHPAGLTIDMWRLWSEKTGIPIEFIPGPLNETVSMLDTGKADAAAFIPYGSQYPDRFDFVSSLAELDSSFFFHRSIFGLKGLEDLRGFKIGIVEGTAGEEFARMKLPGEILTLYPNFPAMLDAMEKGEIRVCIGPTAIVLWWLNKWGLLDEFRFHPGKPLYAFSAYAAVMKGNLELADVVRTGMKLITPDDRALIERKWLGKSSVKAADTIVIAVADDYPPLMFLDERGEPAGMFVDVWRLWANKTQQTIEFHLKPLNDAFNELVIGRADVHLGLLPGPEREELSTVQVPFFESPVSFFFHTGQAKVSSITELAGKEVGVVRGTSDEKLLLERHPGIVVVLFDSLEDMVNAAHDGKIYGFVADAVVALDVVSRLGHSGEFANTGEVISTAKYYTEVQRGRKELSSLIQRGFDDIPNKELADIEARWIQDPSKRYFAAKTGEIKLSDEEKAWIERHPVVNLAVSSGFAPFSFEDGGGFKGMALDYLELFRKRTGVDLRVTLAEPWPKLISTIGERSVDGVVCASRTTERLQYLNFTENYLTTPWVIITRSDYPQVLLGFDDLAGKTVVLRLENPIYETLKTRPDIGLIGARTVEEIWDKVSLGAADAAISNLPSASYYITKKGITNLRVASVLEEKLRLGVGIRNDWPELVGILNKAVTTITPEEHQAIQRKWVTLRYEKQVDWSVVWRWVSIVAGVAGTFLILVLFWNRRLAREIGERKRAEKALVESEAQYRRIVETANEGILGIDKDAIITFVNRNMADMLDYRPEEMIGRSILSFLFSEDLEDHKERMIHRREGLSESYHRRLRRQDGSVCWTLISATPIKSEDGSFAGSFGMFTDITNLKRSEDERLRVHRQKELILNTTEEGIIGLDLGGRITFANRSAVETLGFTAEQLLGGVFHDIAHHTKPDGAPYPFAECPVHQALTLGTSCRVRDEVLWRKDGTSFPAVYSSAPIIEEGRVSGAVVNFRDISYRKQVEKERHRLEECLQRSEKMEALGTMAGGVAHDLNNVLGIVVGYCELLLDDLDESPAKSRAMEIFKGGQRAAAMVQDLLTLARRGVLSRKVLNLNNILLECQDSPGFAKVLSGHPHIEIKTHFEADLLNMSGSAVHLEKSFINLVSNAAEAMPNGGALTIETANRYLDKPISGYDEVREGDYVVLTVSDTGQGIRASDLKHIFEPFYTKKVMGRSGSGLGLAVVWGTVKDHLGYINVESEEGRGTAFTLYFPVTREDVSREEVSTSTAEYMGHGESILVVDDVKEQRNLACALLKKLNYDPVSVSSGEEAVEYLKENTVDLVVLDMIMDPGMDGLDTYSKMLEINPRQKAIIVSGFAETERVGRAQYLGAGAYVKKPYILEKLGLAVRKELERSKQSLPPMPVS